ncbi:unnamed protein product [Sphagnum balticum]
MGELVVGPARRGGRLSKTFPYNRKEEAHGFMGLERRLKCNHVSSDGPSLTGRSQGSAELSCGNKIQDLKVVERWDSSQTCCETDQWPA